MALGLLLGLSLIVAALLIPNGHLHAGIRLYQRNIRPFLPACLVAAVFSAIRVFWPDRMPPSVPHDSPQGRRLVWIKRSAWIAAAVILCASFIIAGGNNGRLLNAFGMAGYVCVALAISLSAYTKLRVVRH